MSTKQQNSFSSVISVNPYNNEYYSGISSFLTKSKTASYSKNQFVVSYLNTKGYINNPIEISKNIPEEDILDAINIKIYDELGLDQAIEYKVQYIETFNNLDDQNRHFQVFIADPLDISETYENVVNTIKYIDVITPTPLLIKSLYSKDIIENSGIHCFIYFEDDDAFATIYNDKEFVYTKSLRYSLKEMHERFCELYGERIEYEGFIEFLSKENLKETSSEYKGFILKLYKEIFANINDILTYAKKAFEIEKVEHIYIGSQIDIASRLYEMSEVELNIKSSDFDFDYGLESSGEHINQIHALMHITTTLPDEEKYLCNFSTFHRPPKFTKRESGKLIIAIAASLFIAFIYPITYWVLMYSQDLQYQLLNSEYKKLHIIKVDRKTKIDNKTEEKKAALALLKLEEDSYKSKKDTLIKIHDVKVNYPMKAKLITTLAGDLNRYTVKMDEIKYDQKDEKKKFTLNLVSSKEKKITQLLEYLTKKHEQKFTFSLEHIQYDEKKKLYFSELKVYIL